MNLCEQVSEYSITCGDRNLYRLDLGYKIIDLTFCQLLSFRTKILGYATHESLEKILETSNFVLLFIGDNKHLIYLDVPQILQLKEVVSALFYSPSVV